MTSSAHSDAQGTEPPRRTAPARTRAGESRHGPISQLLIAWSPLSAILVAYWLAEWVTAPLGKGQGSATNRIGAGLHVQWPARADERLFGGLPSVWLQEHFAAATPQWYDAVAALLYVTHFLAIPLVTAVVWFRLRDRFRQWIAAVLTMTLAGTAGYVLYPAAPPWLASQRNDVPDVDRISNIGWEFLHLHDVGRLVQLGQSGSNPVAAMPSLHASAALLVALFLLPSASPLARLALVAYPLAMGLTLVYTGEHYVVDVLAGWLIAFVAMAAAAAARPRAHRRVRPEP